MINEIVNSDTIIGAEVRNHQDEKLGKIETLMLDKVQGTVTYVILSFGGFLGLGDKLCALPWSIFSYDKAKECFMINLDKEKLKNAPSFDPKQYPAASSDYWKTTVNQYYNVNNRH